MRRFVRLCGVLCVALVSALLIAGCSDGGQTSAPTGAALPSDFPSSQVPLVDGTVLTADGNAKDGWGVTVQGTQNGGNVLDAAVKKLTDAGFAESQRTDTGGQAVAVLSGDKDGKTYWVQVGRTTGAAAGGASVFYVVTVG